MIDWIDAEASNRGGEQLESLVGIANRNSYRPSGTFVSVGAWRAFLRHATIGERVDAALLELVRAGLLLRDGGGLAPRGFEMSALIRDASHQLSIHTSSAGYESLFTMWACEDQALVSVDDPIDVRIGMPEATSSVWFEVSGIESVAARIASWLSLGPAWTFVDGYTVLSRSEFEAKLADEAAPAPATLGKNVRRNWEERWTRWEVRSNLPGLDETFVRAGDSGYFVVTSSDAENVTIHPLPPIAIFRSLMMKVYQRR